MKLFYTGEELPDNVHALRERSKDILYAPELTNERYGKMPATS
ncbi:hypothetical protein AGMMS49949_05350 [Alphaproteobacteria bacterium]|nr:hypothetical protein AGMMS49949_05350 [Alphaproteobacteria bacterium]GHS97495.1 hypothetical protein AGMMS50296_4520 [Alphaproteobacteria bacterium]